MAVPPCRLPNIVRILGKPCRVELPEIRILGMIRRRLSQIIETRPQKLPHRKLQIPVNGNAVFQRPCPPARNAVAKGGALQIIFRKDLRLKRKVIDSPALDNRRSFTSIDAPVGMSLVVLFIIFFGIIISGNFHNIRTLASVLPGHIIRCHRHPGVPLRIPAFHQVF